MSGEYDHLVRYSPEEIDGLEVGQLERKLGLAGYIPIEIDSDELVRIALERGWDVKSFREEYSHQGFLISKQNGHLPPYLLSITVIEKEGRRIPLLGANCLQKLKLVFYG